MRPVRAIILACAALAAAGGCGRTYRSDADRFLCRTPGAGYDRGLVVCLSGAGGFMGEAARLHRGLVAGGADCAIEEFDWSTGLVLVDQVNRSGNRRKAAALARRIETYHQAYPGRPVHLVGVSAGTGLVVWALEDLAPGHRASTATLIAPSLWQKYDLAAALARLEGDLHVYHSRLDAVLGVLVPLVGTVDRGGLVAAGLGGFTLPDGADERMRALYAARLKQVAWKAADAARGHVGDHLGATREAYVREQMAPLVWSRRPRVDPAQEGAGIGAAAAPVPPADGDGLAPPDDGDPPPRPR